MEDRDYELWIIIAQTQEAIYKARTRELARFGISPRKSATLFIIQALGGETTPGEIAPHLFREPHSVSEILTRMETEGLVKKTNNQDGKGHRTRITLTEKGKQLYIHSLERKSIQEIVSCLSLKERQQLRSLLLKLRDKAIESIMEIKLPFPPK